ncbi:MAG: metallophosphoesterase [Phycisphaerae bacterium]|nr:metallophosphoesterase [Phycisphaerae bacterium]
MNPNELPNVRACLLLSLVGILTATVPAWAVDPLPFVPGSWTLVVLPDTQRYTDPASDPKLEIFKRITQWIADSRQARNIKFVLHEGDITASNRRSHWQVASDAMAVLDKAGVPYALVPGNHDHDRNDPHHHAPSRDTLMNDYFTVSRYQAMPTFGGVFEPGRTENSYHLFSAGGKDYITVALEWGPRSEAVAWADKVLSQHSDRTALIVTHAYTYSDGTRYDWAEKRLTQDYNPHHHAYGFGAPHDGTEDVNDGEQLWRKLVSKHKNVRMVFSGHVKWAGARQTAVGNHGQRVHEMVAAYHDPPQGWIRLLEFLPDRRTVQVKTYSPHLDRYMTDDAQQFVLHMAGPPKGTASAVHLSKEHLKAVNRRRRIVVNYDVGYPAESFGVEVKKWVDYRFSYADRPASQIDSLWWCIDEGNLAYYPSKVLPVTKSRNIRRWLDAGIDILKVAVDESHKRGIEAFYTYRLNGYDGEFDERGNSLRPIHLPMKDRHPDWLLEDTWCPGGLWNFAVKGVREYKVAILRELAENYDFDGIDIDFARHPPCLPVGRQWEHRHEMTDFIRRVRLALQDVARKRGRPFLLSVRVPCTVPGCHYDGLDVEAWVKQKLIDIIVIGVHSYEVDLEGFRRIAEASSVKLYPCMDESAHPPDGYRHPGIEFVRGFAANCWQRGADGIVTFNWSNAPAKSYAALGEGPRGAPYHAQAYEEIGDPELLRFKDKMFIVMRRHGGGWTEKWDYYQNSNFEAPLPASLPIDEKPTLLTIHVGDDLTENARRVERVDLRLLLSGAAAGDVIQVKLNGVLLPAPVIEENGWRNFRTRPLQFAVGRNLVSIRMLKRSSGTPSPVTIEKLEVRVAYRP